MKKSIWNKGLFFEGLRRLRGLMITFSALTVSFIAAFAVILSVVGGLADRNYPVEYLTWPLLIIVFIGAPAFALRTFSFLNKRNSSDFFHALPYTRTCMYFSLLTSLIVGIAAVVAVSGAAAFIAYAFLRVGADTVRAVAVLIFCSFVSSVFVASTVVLASSVSGSVFTELVLSTVILIFPQVLIYIFKSFITSSVYTATRSDLYDLAGSVNIPNFNNLPLRLFISYVGGSVEDMTEPLPIIYSVIVCVLYLAVAYILFRHRKSETAERSAPSLKVQAVFRIMIACAFSFIGTLTIAEGIITKQSVNSYVPTAIVMFSLAAIVYFMFELISTKGKRNILKALPGFGVAIALNIAVAGVFYGVYSYEYSFGTDPARVDSMTVCIENVKNVNNGTLWLNDTAYRKCLIEGYEINDADTVNAICNNISYANRNRGNSGSGQLMYLKIKSGLITKTRYFRVFSDVESAVRTQIKQSEKYKKYLKYIPSMQIKLEPYEFVGIFINGEDDKKYVRGYDNLEKVLYSLRAELKDVDADEWESFIKSSSAKKNVYVQYYSEYGYMIIALSDTLTPNAYKTAMKAWEEH